MKDLVKKNGFRIVNKPPKELDQTLQYYKQCLEASLHEPYIMTKDEEVHVKILINQEEFYFMEWNVPKLNYLIKRNNILKTPVSVNAIKSSILSISSHNTLENQRADHADIILLSYPPIASKFIVLGSNKEVFELSQHEHKTVNAYVIEPQVHLQAATRPVYRNLFVIHFNYSLICSYLAGQLTLEEAESRIVPVF